MQTDIDDHGIDVALSAFVDAPSTARALLAVGAIGFGVAYALVLMVLQLQTLILFVFLTGAVHVQTLPAVTPLLNGIANEEERTTASGMNA